MLISKIIKHARQGTLLSVVSDRIFPLELRKSNKIIENTARYNSYYGDKARKYIMKRDNHVRWKLEQSIVKELLSEVPDKITVIDVPFGTGRYLNLYLEKGMSVFGIDISEDMLDAAREIHGNSLTQCNIFVGSADCLPYENDFFDLVVSSRFFTLLPFEFSKKVLSELIRVSKSKLFLNFRIRREGLNYYNFIERIVGVQQQPTKMDQHIYEKDLINMFDEFGLKILRKKIIRKEPGKVNAFYVLEKNSPEN